RFRTEWKMNHAAKRDRLIDDIAMVWSRSPSFNRTGSRPVHHRTIRDKRIDMNFHPKASSSQTFKGVSNDVDPPPAPSSLAPGSGSSFRPLRRLFDDRRDLLGVQKKYWVASGELERLGLGSAGHESFKFGIDLAILLWNHGEARLFR